jgi:hypothetical protein
MKAAPSKLNRANEGAKKCPAKISLGVAQSPKAVLTGHIPYIRSLAFVQKKLTFVAFFPTSAFP